MMRRYSWMWLVVLATGVVVAPLARAQTDMDDGYDGYDGYGAPPPAEQAPEDPVSVDGGDVADVNTFQEPLAPYGEWMDLPGLGRVWRPEVDDDFRPYQTGGHWAYTEAGWTFVSDYDWGWAPFHYGRWWNEAGYGWVWVPGTQWAPAWVDWRFGGDYAGWAPMPPVGFQFGVTTGWGSPWCFVQTQYLAEPGWWSYRVPVEQVGEVYRTTEVVPVMPVRTGVAYSAGPPLRRVVAAVGHPITPVRVAEMRRVLPPSGVAVAHPLMARGRPLSAASALNRGFQNRPGVEGRFDQPGRSGWTMPQRSAQAPRPSSNGWSRPNAANAATRSNGWAQPVSRPQPANTWRQPANNWRPQPVNNGWRQPTSTWRQPANTWRPQPTGNWRQPRTSFQRPAASSFSRPANRFSYQAPRRQYFTPSVAPARAGYSQVRRR